MSQKLSRTEMCEVYSYENIRQYRNEKCFSQEYVASLLKIEQSTYQRIEAGKIKVSTNRLAQLAVILGKPVEIFFKQSSYKKQPVEEITGNLMEKIIKQQEKRIEELEAKIQRKDKKIDELKFLLTEKKDQ